MIAANKDPAMGPSGYARIADDFYPTPAWCTEALLKYFTPRGMIWEPACGLGHISKVLEAAGHTVHSTDLIDRGFGSSNRNFLMQMMPPGVGTIITNPPYSGDLPQQFVLHALKLTEPAKGSVATLLRNEYDSASGRTALFRHPAFSMKLVLTKRPRWIEGSTGAPRHNYSWFCWDWATVGTAPTIVWDR